MLSRRTAMKSLVAIIPLGFLERIYANTPKSVPGVSYFKVNTPNAKLPKDKTILLNGVDMRFVGSEADLIEGWIVCNTPYRLYRDGKVADAHQVTNGPLVKRRIYGSVTLGPR